MNQIRQDSLVQKPKPIGRMKYQRETMQSHNLEPRDEL